MTCFCIRRLSVNLNSDFSLENWPGIFLLANTLEHNHPLRTLNPLKPKLNKITSKNSVPTSKETRIHYKDTWFNDLYENYTCLRWDS